jgi:hypothetical protein
VFAAPLRSNGRGADHRKHSLSVAVPMLLSCLLLRERVYRKFGQKRPSYIRPSRGRCIATALHVTIYRPSHGLINHLFSETFAETLDVSSSIHTTIKL